MSHLFRRRRAEEGCVPTLPVGNSCMRACLHNFRRRSFQRFALITKISQPVAFCEEIENEGTDIGLQVENVFSKSATELMRLSISSHVYVKLRQRRARLWVTVTASRFVTQLLPAATWTPSSCPKCPCFLELYPNSGDGLIQRWRRKRGPLSVRCSWSNDICGRL